MNHASTLLAATLLCSGAFAQETGFTLSFDGYGPLKFGMPAERVLRILNQEKPYNVAASDSCKQVTLPQFALAGLSFTMEQQKLVRIDVDFTTGRRETSAKTDAGIGLGSPEADVLKAYPSARIKPNPDDPSWHRIVVETPDHSRGLIFETNGQSVKSIRGGLRPAISSVEGCN